MNDLEDGAAARSWLARLLGSNPVDTAPPGQSPAEASAALVAESMSRGRSLLIVTADDLMLADISNAIDLDLRPLCLVLPAADPACRVALRATLSLLKSRLARAGARTEGPAWTAARQSIAEQAPLWRRSLDWSQRDVDNEAWPIGLEALFPVRVMPLALARTLASPAEWVVRVDGAPSTAAGLAAWPGAARTLWLAGAENGRTGPLVPIDRSRARQAELDLLTQELSELELELATAQAEIADFTRRYHAVIGTRLSTLDELRADLAERRRTQRPDDPDIRRDAESARARATQSRLESERLALVDHRGAGSQDARPFEPTLTLKKLYRQLAQRIHPDRARDERDRAWRHQLMTEANLAYQAGDEAALREILVLWREGAGKRDATGVRDDDGFDAAIASLKRRITAIERELNGLFGSRLYELFTACNIARRAGRDLLTEMATRLDADIADVRAQLAESGP